MPQVDVVEEIKRTVSENIERVKRLNKLLSEVKKRINEMSDENFKEPVNAFEELGERMDDVIYKYEKVLMV